MMYQDVLKFWFEETPPTQWWHKSRVFDELITDRFAELHAQAVRCELASWRADPKGRLAEIIVLDQFSRNIYRHQARAFAYDGLALALAQEAIAAGADKVLSAIERHFLYLPFMHSESPHIHRQAVELYRADDLGSGLEFELAHKKIIDDFGRYPHRNQVLGRASTLDELSFLKQAGAAF